MRARGVLAWVLAAGTAFAGALVGGAAAGAQPSALSACAGAPAAPEPQVEAKLVRLVNAARAGAGRRPLAVSAVLARIARDRTAEMARSGAFGHRGLGWAPAGTAAGETLALVTSPRMAVSMWLASSTHRATLLGAGYRLTGVGAFRACGGMLLITQEFFRPRS